ncbi:MAG: aminotransferase class V-fold PLP-dependent enzyme [Cocleimonas sp.]
MEFSYLAHGKLFSDTLMQHVKDSFYHVDSDYNGKRRLFFDNAGGSFRLKKAVETYGEVSATPDCAERIHNTAVYLQEIESQGEQDFKMMLNVDGGTVYTALTASKAMFDMVRVIVENVSGTNMVTTVLEHPSAYDAMELNAARTGRELRVAKSNATTGGIDVDEIIKLVDQDTVLLSVIYASNISGAKLDIESIVTAARAIKPDLYIVIDAVQHAPHGVIDLKKLPIDGINIAPYKFFGCRGMGLAWLSDRAALFPHDKLSGKDKGVWDLGSSDPAQFAMFSEVINYVCDLGTHETNSLERREQFVTGMQMINLHERALLSRMLNGSEGVTGLREIDNLNVYLDHDDLTMRDLILAIDFKNIEPPKAVKIYDEKGVTAFERVNTSLYSKRMLESFGLEGAIRVSPLHCHSANDIDTFLSITKQMASGN